MLYKWFAKGQISLTFQMTGAVDLIKRPLFLPLIESEIAFLNQTIMNGRLLIRSVALLFLTSGNLKNLQP